MAGVALGVRLHRRALDRDLASGIAGWRSPAHAARVRQLTHPKHRRRVAHALEHLLWAAATPRAQLARGAVAPCRVSVAATAGQIMSLAGRLRSDEPVAAAGVARLEALLTDGAGPVYADGRAEALAGALNLAAQWLDAGE
jgi:hypothetical protein